MHYMLMLGGLGMLLRKILKNRCSEIESEGISASKYCIIALVQDFQYQGGKPK